MKILLHVDDSAHWIPAARLARPLVLATGGTLTAFSTSWSRVKRERAFREARRVLALPDARFTTHARPGLAEYVIPEEARDRAYDLVVLGRLGALDRLTNGLIADLVARFTPTQTLVVRGKSADVDRVVVAAAGTPATSDLVRTAALVAHAYGARLTILHVLSQFGLTHESAEAVDALGEDFLPSGTPEAAELTAARDAAAATGLDVDLSVRVGLVVDETLDEIRKKGHDLLVIGAHGTEVREKLLQEDVASIILRASPVSTLVVRSPSDAYTPPGWPDRA